MHLQLYSAASLHIELAAISTRVLACGTYNAIRRGDEIPSALPEGIQELSQSVRYLASYLEEAVGLQGTQTAAKAASWLERSGYEVTEGVGGTGVVGVLRNGRDRP